MVNFVDVIEEEDDLPVDVKEEFEEHIINRDSGETLSFMVRKLLYELEFYAMVHALQTWEHYLIQQEFVLFTNHHGLKNLNSHTTINRMHARSISFI